MAVIDLVEVCGQDALLAVVAGEGPSQVARLQDLLDLAHQLVTVEHVLGQQPGAHELLGDRRRATVARAADALQDGRSDRIRVEALVLPERPILNRDRRVEQDLGDLVEGDHAPALDLEAGQLDRPCPVIDDRRLGKVELLEAGHRGQLGLHLGQERQPGGDRHDSAEGDEAKNGEQHQHAGRGVQTEAALGPRLGAHARQREAAHRRVRLGVALAALVTRRLSSIHA